MRKSTIEKYTKLEGTTIGKYKLLKFITDGYENRFKVKCMKCGWIGIQNYKSIARSPYTKMNKCTHPGGNIKPGKVYGKYTVLKREPSRLYVNDALLPMYKVKCNVCGEVCVITSGTLLRKYEKHTDNSAFCRHKKEG